MNTLPAGPSIRASDPVVAYDAAHGVWLANTLAIAQGVTRLTIHRSPDGLTWTGPIDAALTRSEDLAYDKNWLTCDNGAASPYRGRCYLAYTLVADPQDSVAVQRSDDGGRTWSPPVTLQINVTGVIPVVQPNGMLHLVFWSPRTGMVSVPSTDGGATLGQPATIAAFESRNARPFRAPPLVAADVDAAGGLLAVWQDCRFNAGCSANDIVLSRSTDGMTWSQPARVTSGRNAVMPTIGVEPRTGRLAIVYYVIREDGIDAELVTSANGARWSTPQRLSPQRMPLAWMPADDARAHACRLHRRQLGPRPAARDLRARLAAPERETAPSDLRRPRLSEERQVTVCYVAPSSSSRSASGGLPRDATSRRSCPAVGASPRRRCSWTSTRICS